MLRMVSYSRRPKSGQITCYLNRTYHVLTTGPDPDSPDRVRPRLARPRLCPVATWPGFSFRGDHGCWCRRFSGVSLTQNALLWSSEAP